MHCGFYVQVFAIFKPDILSGIEDHFFMAATLVSFFGFHLLPLPPMHG
jgi:hypothetical protein